MSSVKTQIKHDEKDTRESKPVLREQDVVKHEVSYFIDDLVKNGGYDIDYLDAFLVDAGYLVDTEVTRHEFMGKLSEFQKEFA
ncbi:hypothetical protein [Candidatus Borreliella tachyglossi]|uniref:hypothetical protein n=1 Tax=Candidatus Borreliella tachyglossi TaxID=1964448 RepID=UPI00404387FD